VARNPASRTGKRSSAAIADEQAQCLDLRRKGKSIRDIAAETGIPRNTVSVRIKAALDEIVTPLADDVRKLELERLDAWQRRLEADLESPRADATKIIPVGLKVQERRSRYLGLDAPERTEVSVPQLAPDDAQSLGVLARAREAAAARVAALRGDR
jgi:hypothetical protein